MTCRAAVEEEGLAGRPRRFDRGFPSTARWLVSSIFNDGAALSRNVHAKQLQRVVYAIPENALEKKLRQFFPCVMVRERTKAPYCSLSVRDDGC